MTDEEKRVVKFEEPSQDLMTLLESQLADSREKLHLKQREKKLAEFKEYVDGLEDEYTNDEKTQLIEEYKALLIKEGSGLQTGTRAYKSHEKNRQNETVSVTNDTGQSQVFFKGKFGLEANQERKGRRHSVDSSLAELETPDVKNPADVKFKTKRGASLVSGLEQQMMKNAEEYMEKQLGNDTAAIITKRPAGDYHVVVITPGDENAKKNKKKENVTKQILDREVIQEFSERKKALDAAVRYISRKNTVSSSDVNINIRADPCIVVIENNQTTIAPEQLMEFGAIQQTIELTERYFQRKYGAEIVITPNDDLLKPLTVRYRDDPHNTIEISIDDLKEYAKKQSKVENKAAMKAEKTTAQKTTDKSSSEPLLYSQQSKLMPTKIQPLVSNPVVEETVQVKPILKHR